MSSGAWLMVGTFRSMELLGFGRALEGGGLRLAAGDREVYGVEIAGAHFALVLDGGVTVALGRELRLLQLAVPGHAARAEGAGELEARVVEAVEAGKRDELVLVAHGADRFLEGLDLPGLQIGAPVEARRAVVGEELAGERRVDRLGEPPGLGEVGPRGLPPEHVGIGRIGEATRDAIVDADALLDAVEALGRPRAALDEGVVALVDIRGDELRALGIGACHNQGRSAADVGREPRRVEGADEALHGYQHLAAQVPALLLGGKLVLEMHAGGARLDHRLHELEGVERPAEARLGVGDDRRIPIGVALSFQGLDLIGALKRLVDAPHHRWNGVRRIEALVRIDLASEVRIRRHLPAREVDRLEAGAHHLHRLIAGERTERGDIRPRMQELPEPPGPKLRERVRDPDRAAEPRHVLCGEVAADAVEAAGLYRRFRRDAVIKRAHRTSMRTNLLRRNIGVNNA